MEDKLFKNITQAKMLSSGFHRLRHHLEIQNNYQIPLSEKLINFYRHKSLKLLNQDLAKTFRHVMEKVGFQKEYLMPIDNGLNIE